MSELDILVSEGIGKSLLAAGAMKAGGIATALGGAAAAGHGHVKSGLALGATGALLNRAGTRLANSVGKGMYDVVNRGSKAKGKTLANKETTPKKSTAVQEGVVPAMSLVTIAMAAKKVLNK